MSTDTGRRATLGAHRADHRLLRRESASSSSSSPRRSPSGASGQRAALAARRAPGSVRHPGHRRHRVDGPQPHADREPGHLPDRHDVPRRARRSRRCAASRCSGCRSSTSSSRTAPTSTGRARGWSSTSRRSRDKLPEGVTPQIGPDATSVGWVFQYALVDESGQHNLQELRSLPGLVPALLAPGARGRRRGRERRRVREGVPDPGRPGAHEGAQRLGRPDRRRRARRRTPRSAAASSRWRSTSTRCAGAATSRARRTSSSPSSRPTRAARRSASATWPT